MAQDKNIGDALLDALVDALMELAPDIAAKGLRMEHKTTPVEGSIYALVTLSRKDGNGGAAVSRGTLLSTLGEVDEFARSVRFAAGELAKADDTPAGEREAWERIADRLITPEEMDIVKGRPRNPLSRDFSKLERAMARLIDERFSEMENVMRRLLASPVRRPARLVSRASGERTGRCTME